MIITKDTKLEEVRRQFPEEHWSIAKANGVYNIIDFCCLFNTNAEIYRGNDGELHAREVKDEDD